MSELSIRGIRFMATTVFDDKLGGFKLAYRQDGGADELGLTGFFWLGGFKSAMSGTKGEALADLARSSRRRCLRFDYSGHGESSGLFADGTISAWLEQAVHMFLTHTKGRRIIVGSSMGGWLALLLARRLRNEDASAFRRIAGMVLIAPATDMTQDLMWNKFGDAEKAELKETGVYMQPSAYGEPYEITTRLLADGMQHMIFEDGLNLPFPVRILQGSEDADVPPAHAIKTFEALNGSDISLTFIKGGDHRLSTPGQIQMIQETVLRLAERAEGISF
jgi:pimeloyl-ACP methyl ester carboxylesterase